MSEAPALMALYGVTYDDLVANVHGRLGPSQARKLRRAALVNGTLTCLATAGVVWFGLRTLDPPVAPWQYAIFAGLALALLAVGARWVLRLLRAVQDGTVARHSGPVRLHAHGQGAALVSGDRTVPLPGVARLVTDGQRYDAYVVTRLGTVVAVVPDVAG